MNQGSQLTDLLQSFDSFRQSQTKKLKDEAPHGTSCLPVFLVLVLPRQASPNLASGIGIELQIYDAVACLVLAKRKLEEEIKL